MELGFEECDDYSRDLIQAKDRLADLEQNGIEGLNPRPLPYPPENPAETLRATIEQTRKEIADLHRKLMDCARRYLDAKGWW